MTTDRDFNPATYSQVTPASLAARITQRQRRLMYAAFLALLAPEPGDSVVDVGVSRDRSLDGSNYLEEWYPDKSRLTAVGVDDAAFLAVQHPGLTFLRADGRALPFADGAFDFAFSSAVIEHVGSRAQQTDLLKELWRVARKGVFATTPNRWFPIETHTILPLLHWLPPDLFRAALRRSGRRFFAEEQNLNLLSRRDLAACAQAAGIARFRVESVKLWFWPSNLLLIARKAEGA